MKDTQGAKDLETVKSMGFRGEALASIAAIAHVELTSRTADSELGYKIVVEGGNIITKEVVGCPKGTTIIVENLFYNTPVRYKFLKKDFTETGYVEDAVTRIALVNPNVSVKLINLNKNIKYHPSLSNEYININIDGNNTTSKDIKLLMGNIIMYKNNKIVEAKTFGIENIKSKSSFSKVVSFSNVDYDKIEVYYTFAY